MNTGFTLIEALVALIVLTLVVMVVLETQMTTLNLEQAARSTQRVRLEVERVVTEARIGNELTHISAETSSDCAIQCSALPSADTGDSAEMIQWDIVPRDRPALKTIVYTRRFE